MLPNGVASLARRMASKVSGETMQKRLRREAAEAPLRLPEKLPRPVHKSHAERARLKESS